MDIISKEGIYSFLPVNLKNKFNVSVVEKTDSTNLMLKNMALNGAEEGTVVVAGEQTAGIGRMGRSFFSPAGSGLYFSMLLRPRGAAVDALQITVTAAVAEQQDQNDDPPPVVTAEAAADTVIIAHKITSEFGFEWLGRSFHVIPWPRFCAEGN